MTIEQLMSLLKNRNSQILEYEENDIYELFEPNNSHWRYGIEKEHLHGIVSTSFKGMELIKNISDFFALHDM